MNLKLKNEQKTVMNVFLKIQPRTGDMEKKERKRKATIDDSPIKKQQRRSSDRFDLDGKQLRFYESGGSLHCFRGCLTWN
jgi:hypothetical protein